MAVMRATQLPKAWPDDNGGTTVARVADDSGDIAGQIVKREILHRPEA